MQPAAQQQSPAATALDLENALENILWNHRVDATNASMDLSDLCDDDEDSCEILEGDESEGEGNESLKAEGGKRKVRTKDELDIDSLDDLLGTRIV